MTVKVTTVRVIGLSVTVKVWSAPLTAFNLYT